MWTIGHRMWVSYGLWDNFWRANYRASLGAVLISGVLLVRKNDSMWHRLFGTLPKVTKLLKEEMNWEPWFYLELYEMAGIVTFESYWIWLLLLLFCKLYLRKAVILPCLQGIVSWFNNEPNTVAVSLEKV